MVSLIWMKLCQEISTQPENQPKPKQSNKGLNSTCSLGLLWIDRQQTGTLLPAFKLSRTNGNTCRCNKANILPHIQTLVTLVLPLFLVQFYPQPFHATCKYRTQTYIYYSGKHTEGWKKTPVSMLTIAVNVCLCPVFQTTMDLLQFISHGRLNEMRYFSCSWEKWL